MAKELKVRVKGSLESWKSRLSELGNLEKDVVVEDIYFDTKSNDVLKISRKKEGDSVVRFKYDKGNFVVQPQEKVEDFEQKLEELTQKYGVKKTVSRHQIVYKLDDGTIEIDVIDGIDIFLVLIQENPKLEWFDLNLNLKSLEQITVPFSDL